MSPTFHSLFPFTFLHKVKQFLKTHIESKGLFKWWTEGVHVFGSYPAGSKNICSTFDNFGIESLSESPLSAQEK